MNVINIGWFYLSKNTGYFFSFGAYRACAYINCSSYWVVFLCYFDDTNINLQTKKLKRTKPDTEEERLKLKVEMEICHF